MTRSVNTGANDYYKLLADPCGAALVTAPYAGMGSSLLVRTTEYFQPAAISGTGAVLDFAYEWTPWNAPTHIVGDTIISNGVLTPISVPIQNFVTDASIVKSFRPIAGCLKWLPNGPISSRAGIVGLAYAPARSLAGTTGQPAREYLAQSQSVHSNGAVNHECKWLPSFEDERFGAAGEANVNGGGTVTLVGQGVDATAGVVRGLIEMTTVWEWTPVGGSGVNTSFNVPKSISLQTILSSIRDIGSFVHSNSRVIRGGLQLIGDYASGRGNSFLLNN